MAFEDTPPLWWMIVDGIMDCFFVVEIVLNFLTGFREKKEEGERGEIVMSCRRSALNYVKNWFLIDLLSTLPLLLIDLVTKSFQPLNTLLLIARLLRLFKLPRLFSWMRIMRKSCSRKCKIKPGKY